MTFSEIQAKMINKAYNFPNEFVADMRELVEGARREASGNLKLTATIATISRKVNQLAGRLLRYRSVSEREDDLTRWLELARDSPGGHLFPESGLQQPRNSDGPEALGRVHQRLRRSDTRALPNSPRF
jgi:hypothetical protein